MSSLLEYGFVSRARHELLRTRIAIERYRLERGEWPGDLSALVPAYLDALPSDPMDGNPLRYDPVRKRIYSIGDDLIDERGVAPGHGGSLESTAEIVIELEPDDLP